MMKITFDRSGGVIGTDMHLDLDLNSMPADEAQNLLRLVNETGFFDIPENLNTQPLPDEFQYEITVHSGNASHTVRTSDSTMPKSLHPLVKELTMLKMLES
jgi:hypothetical protein